MAIKYVLNFNNLINFDFTTSVTVECSMFWHYMK